MEQLQLKANIRKETGNGPARVLRREGKMPAVIYGPDTEPILLALDISDLEKRLKNQNLNQLLFNLAIEDGKTKTRSVMIKELQVHPVTRKYLHGLVPIWSPNSQIVALVKALIFVLIHLVGRLSRWKRFHIKIGQQAFLLHDWDLQKG